MSSRSNRRNKREIQKRYRTNNNHSQTPLDKIAQSVEPELLSGNMAESKKHLVKHTKFEGPLPHPDIFKKYGDIIPDAPERILSVFEKDSSHIREVRINALEAQKSDNSRVHWMAWSLILSGYIIAAFFAWIDKDWLAALTLTSTIGGTILGFIQNKRPQNNE